MGVEGVTRIDEDACPVGSVSEQSLSPQTMLLFLEPNDLAALGPTALVT